MQPGFDSSKGHVNTSTQTSATDGTYIKQRSLHWIVLITWVNHGRLPLRKSTLLHRRASHSANWLESRKRLLFCVALFASHDVQNNNGTRDNDGYRTEDDTYNVAGRQAKGNVFSLDIEKNEGLRRVVAVACRAASGAIKARCANTAHASVMGMKPIDIQYLRAA